MGKPLKNIDSVTRAQLVKSFCWIFPWLAVIGFFLRQFTGIVIAAVVSVPLSFAVVLIADKFGIFAGALYGGRRPHWEESQFYEADVDRIRHLKVKKDYGRALREINRLLAQSPNLTEALYLKAQILHEGFDNTEAAKRSLDKILAGDGDEDDPIYRWAVSLKETLSKKRNGGP